MSTFDRLFAMKDFSALKSPKPALNTQQPQSSSVLDKPIKPTSTYVPASLFSPVPKIKQPMAIPLNDQDAVQAKVIKPIPFRGGPADYLLGGNPFLVPLESCNTDQKNICNTGHKRSSLSSSYISNLQEAIKTPSSMESSSTIFKDTSSIEEFIQKDLDGELPSPLRLPNASEGSFNAEPVLLPLVEKSKSLVRDTLRMIPNPVPTGSKNSSINEQILDISNSINTSVKDIVPHVTLREWRIQRVPNDPEITKHSSTDYPLWIIIEGTRKSADSDTKQLWHSSLIVDRIDSRMLLTSTGKCYCIEGEMDRHAWTEADLPNYVIEAFEDGFPHDWKQVLRPCLQIERICRTGSRRERNRSNAELPVIYTKAETSKRNALTDRPRKIVKRKKLSLEVALTKSLTPASQLSLPVSRSGRKIVPPLAFWMNEYAKRSKDGQLYIIKANQASSLKLS